MNIGWRVIYKNSNFEYPQYPEIDRENLTDFILYDKDNDSINLLWVNVKKGQTLVYRTAVSQDFSNSEIQARIYSVGLYDFSLEKPLIKVYNLIQDGRKLETDFWPRFVQPQGQPGKFVLVQGPEPTLRIEEKKT